MSRKIRQSVPKRRLQKVICWLTMIGASFLLAACGGGGSSNVRDPLPPEAQQPPVPEAPAPETPAPETLAPEAPPLAANEAMTEQGILTGSIEGDLKIFKGVRYAASPTGDLRFKAPELPPVREDPADAIAFGADCPQNQGAAVMGDEDCLFLNVWAHNDDNGSRPVLVWIHGGGSVSGSGSSPLYDGSALAIGGDVVVVTINYRLGALGYLALVELVNESPRSTAGNYGLLDAIAALEWVQDNIDGFGGDPNRVLLFGESAGGRAICHILGAPEAAGLFQAAALQSAGCSRRLVLNGSVSEASDFPPLVVQHRALLPEVGCDTAADVLACLRGLPIEVITDAQTRVPLAGGRENPFGPNIDGVVVQSNPYTALANQVVGDIPIIVGANKDEAVTFVDAIPIPDDAAYRNLLAEALPEPLDDQVYALYPTADFPTARDAYLTFVSDAIFNCVAEELARSAQGGAPSYLYTLSRGFDTGSRAGLGAVHVVDVPYLFDTFDVFGYTPDAPALAIRDSMQLAWSSLVTDVATAPPYLPAIASAWPVFDIDNVQIVDFDDPVAVVNGHRAGRCSDLRTLLTM